MYITDLKPTDILMMGGPITTNILNHQFVNLIDIVAQSGCQVIVGDTFGADRMIQGVLLTHLKPERITVYHTGPEIRCMLKGLIGHVTVEPPDEPGGKLAPGYWQRFYGAKDIAMRKACTAGMFTWDGRDKTTYANVRGLRAASKPVWLWNSPAQLLERLHNA